MSPKVLYSCIHAHIRKNWHCNPNTSLILPQEEFFHKGISSSSLEGNIILSENMLSNNVARILRFWFKSASGYADTVSAACDTSPPPSLPTCFGSGPRNGFGSLWLLSGKYLPACCTGLWILAIGAVDKKRRDGIRSEVPHVFYWTRTLQQF